MRVLKATIDTASTGPDGLAESSFTVLLKLHRRTHVEQRRYRYTQSRSRPLLVERLT